MIPVSGKWNFGITVRLQIKLKIYCIKFDVLSSNRILYQDITQGK